MSLTTAHSELRWGGVIGGATSLGAVLVMCLGASCAAPPDTGTPEESDSKSATALVHQLDTARLQEHSWGWIRWLINSEIDPEATMTLGVVQVKAQQRNPFHVHSGCEEYLYVVSGSCEHRIKDEWVTLKAGDAIRIPAGVSHAARTLEEPMQAIIVYNSGTRDFAVVEE